MYKLYIKYFIFIYILKIIYQAYIIITFYFKLISTEKTYTIEIILLIIKNYLLYLQLHKDILNVF